ncbi:MAG: hypothetical protein LBI33_02250, partial [Propionibacteriaceae bacterium]|nr:hypothetical protein [Propionibacteriaceae bacterium]
GPLLAAVEDVPDLIDSVDWPDGGVDVLALLTSLRDSGNQLVTGANQVADGTAALADGLPVLTSGIAQVADGMPLVVSGVTQVSTGLDTLAAQTPALVDGIAQSADGASALAAGADALTSGLALVANGSSPLVDGSRQLADGLAAGLDQLPTYSDADRAALKNVVTSPIDTTDLNGTAGFGDGWTALILLLALWLGALATYLVVRPIRARQLDAAGNSWRLVAEALAPGLAVAAQAVLTAVVALVVLHLPFVSSLTVAGLLLLAGAVFVVVNFALVAWLKGIGRLVAVAFAVVTITGGLTTATPGVFTLVRSFSPVTTALDAIQIVIAGGSGLAAGVLSLLGWLVLGLAAAALAVLRARTTTFDALADAETWAQARRVNPRRGTSVASLGTRVAPRRGIGESEAAGYVPLAELFPGGDGTAGEADSGTGASNDVAVVGTVSGDGGASSDGVDFWAAPEADGELPGETDGATDNGPVVADGGATGAGEDAVVDATARAATNVEDDGRAGEVPANEFADNVPPADNGAAGGSVTASVPGEPAGPSLAAAPDWDDAQASQTWTGLLETLGAERPADVLAQYQTLIDHELLASGRAHYERAGGWLVQLRGYAAAAGRQEWYDAYVQEIWDAARRRPACREVLTRLDLVPHAA